MATETEISLVYNRFAGTLNNPTVTYSITGVTGTTEYKYKVTAWNEQGETDGTEVVISNGPSELNQGQYIRLEWQAVDRARRYRIYRYYNGVYAFLNDTDQLFYEDTSADTPDTNINPPTENNTNKLNWDAVEFLPGRRLQSAELNEIQAIQEYNVQKIGDNIFKDGDIISGCQITVDKDNNKILISEGEVYVKGRIRPVEAVEYEVDTFENKTWYIGATLSHKYIDASDDPALLDPAQAYPGYGEEGALRRVTVVSWEISDVENEITTPIYVVENGVLRKYYTPPMYSVLENTLARKINDLEGMTLIEGLDLVVYPHATRRDTVVLEVSPGKAYINGYEVIKTDVTKLEETISLDESNLIQETQSPETGWLYKPDLLPISNVLTVTKRTFVAETRTVPSDTDGCGWYKDNTGSSLDIIIGVWDSSDKTTQYTESTSLDCVSRDNDYVLDGSSICLNPATFTAGTSYYVEYLRLDTCVEGSRVKSYQQDSFTYSLGTNTYTLSKTDIIVNVNNPVTIIDANNNTYEQNVDFTVDKGWDETSISSASITFIGNKPADGVSFTVEYNYWNHLVEGDFVYSKSYLDPTDPFANYNYEDIPYPDYIDFRSATTKPANENTEIIISYKYYLSKYSYLVVSDTGEVSNVYGDPAYNPIIPHRPTDVLPRYRIYWPALSQNLGIVEIGRYEVMRTEDRNLLADRVKNLEYNLLLTELEQELHNKATISPKKAIFTDSFTEEDVRDPSETKCTIVNYKGAMLLPQKPEQLNVVTKNLTNIELMPYSDGTEYVNENILIGDSLILLNYEEETVISNTLWTEDYAEDVTPFIYASLPVVKVLPKVWLYYDLDIIETSQPQPETTPTPTPTSMLRFYGGTPQYANTHRQRYVILPHPHDDGSVTFNPFPIPDEVYDSLNRGNVRYVPSPPPTYIPPPPPSTPVTHYSPTPPTNPIVARLAQMFAGHSL